MDLNKFTEKSQAALMEAQNIATRDQHQAVDVEHLMLALIEQEGGLVPRLFEKAKVAPDLLKAKVEEELNRIPRVSGREAFAGQIEDGLLKQCHALSDPVFTLDEANKTITFKLKRDPYTPVAVLKASAPTTG